MWGVEICKIYSKIMKKYHHCVKFTYPLSFQTRIPKVDQHTGGKWLIHGTKHCIILLTKSIFFLPALIFYLLGKYIYLPMPKVPVRKSLKGCRGNRKQLVILLDGACRLSSISHKSIGTGWFMYIMYWFRRFRLLNPCDMYMSYFCQR